MTECPLRVESLACNVGASHGREALAPAARALRYGPTMGFLRDVITGVFGELKSGVIRFLAAAAVGAVIGAVAGLVIFGTSGLLPGAGVGAIAVVGIALFLLSEV